MEGMRTRQLAIVLGAAALGTGCAAQRELIITSNPPGALIRLDDTVVGTTPYTMHFDAYGTRRITLYREGYRTASRVVAIDPPWYAYFPIDVVSEVLLPFGWRDSHPQSFELEPESGQVTRPDLNAVLLRAESLRLAEPTGPRPSILEANPHEKPQERPKEKPE
jgi:hypothetical protein